MSFKDITVTIIFEGSALNRDEKIGGNIQSIKKLTIGDKVISFISRPAIRHYLFNTLKRMGWRESGVRLAKNDIIQFDITQFNIQNCEELDAFGYMYTIGNISITRKAPVGITKAISLLPYNQDMSLYSNHDLVRRAKDNGFENPQPDLNNREENSSFFKVSFTIDSKCLGRETLIADEVNNNNTIKIKYKEDNNIKELEINELNFNSTQIQNSDKYKVEIVIDDDKKKHRICQILNAIRNGLVAHSSGEDNTIVPLFMIAAPVKVPSPVFHPYIDLVMDGGKPKVIGISDCINCINNSWVDGGKVYIQDSERLKVDKENINDKLYISWEEFLTACGLDNCNCNATNQSNQQTTATQ